MKKELDAPSNPVVDAKINAKRIVELLRAERHAGEEWSTFTEVRNATGFTDPRYMDLFAVNVWPSKAYRSVAYEVKVDRSDFMKEILDPTKRELAETVAMECWFATPSGLVQKDEVPEGWGLVTISTTGQLKTLKMPRQRKPKAWDMGFIASLLRKASMPPSEVPTSLWRLAGREITEAELLQLAHKQVEKQKDKTREEVEAELEEQHKRNLEWRDERIKRFDEFKAQVAKALGIKEHPHWHGEDDLLLTLKAGINRQAVAEMKRLHQSLAKSLKSLGELP